MREQEQEEEDPIESYHSSSLRKSIEFLTSLISLSHSIRVFPAKWQSIRTKLEELNSSLVSLQDCDASAANSGVTELVISLMETIADCYELARRCVDLSYSGKLLMKSDLDVVAAKFDDHSKRLAEIYDAGVLTRGCALVVSRPSFGACRDDMRFYVRDLVTRMRVGDSAMKRQALASLYSAVAEEEKYVGVVAELGDIIAVIVNFLDSPESQIREGSARVVHEILGFSPHKSVLIGAGVIAPLVRLLESRDDPARELSAKCLMKVTENSDNAWSVSAHGGVTALLKICSDEDSSPPELLSSACVVLQNLAGVEEIRRFMAEEGAVPTLARLAQAKHDPLVQTNSMELLRHITNTTASGGGAGATAALSVFLAAADPHSSCGPKAREIALRAINDHLLLSSSSASATLLSGQFTNHLILLLGNDDDVAVQELALKVAAKLSATSEDAKRALGEAGLMRELMRFLDSKSPEIRELACEVLLGMVLLPKNRKKFVQDDRSIGLILKQLDPERQNSAGSKRLLLSILMCLTHSNSGRRKIAANGNLRNIEKLAQAEVSDAKKLVRKLATSRFRTLFNAILWHSN